MNTDMIDRRSMLAVAPHVVFLVSVADAPVISAAYWALVNVLEVAMRFQVIDIVGELPVWKGVLFQSVLVGSQIA